MKKTNKNFHDSIANNTIVMGGLAFKAEITDMSKVLSWVNIKHLIEHFYTVKAFYTIVMQKCKIPIVEIVNCCKNSHNALLSLIEWKYFILLSLRIKKTVKKSLLIDCCNINIYDGDSLGKKDFDLYCAEI